MSYYNGSLTRALAELYPEIKFDESKFKFKPRMFLSSPSSIILMFFSSLSCYQVSTGTIWKTDGTSSRDMHKRMGLTP